MKFIKWCFSYADARCREEFSFTQLLHVTAIALGCCHVLLLLLFWEAGVYPMAVINIFSILTYITCYHIVTLGKTLLFYCIVYLEVFIHVMLATIMVGEQAGFTLHLIAITAVDYLCCYGYVTENHTDQKFHPAIFCLLSFGLLAFLRFFESTHEPFYPFRETCTYHIFYITNFMITMCSLIFALSMFTTQILALRNRLIQQNSMLEELSMTDTLTGLSNRRVVMKFFNDSKLDNTPFCAILADIDDFKKINDSYGHNCGDKVLIAVANTFRTCIRKSDILCRWGGEEILVILPLCDTENAVIIAQKIKSSLSENRMTYKNQEISVSMTFGFSSSDEVANAEAAVHKADTYLYYGKRHGKNCIITAEHVKRREMTAVTSSFNAALQRPENI